MSTTRDRTYVYYKGLEFGCYPSEIFYNVLYRFQQFQKLNLPLRTALDIGAHHGSLALLAAHNGARKVVAVDPIHWEMLKKNVTSCGFDDIIEVVPKACTNGVSPVDLKFVDDAGMQSFFYNQSKRPPVSAPGVSFVELMEKFDTIDYLKIDCEGAEYNFIEPTKEIEKLFRDKVGFLDFEFHHLFESLHGMPGGMVSNHPLIHPYYLCEDCNETVEKLKALLQSWGFNEENSLL